MSRILLYVADDLAAERIGRELALRGCSIETDDGSGGLAAAETLRPDLILLYVELPKLSGFSICNKLRRHPVLRSVPLFLISSMATEETFVQHRRLKTAADEYFREPLDIEELLNKVREYLDLGQPASHRIESSESGFVVRDVLGDQMVARVSWGELSKATGAEPWPRLEISWVEEGVEQQLSIANWSASGRHLLDELATFVADIESRAPRTIVSGWCRGGDVQWTSVRQWPSRAASPGAPPSYREPGRPVEDGIMAERVFEPPPKGGWLARLLGRSDPEPPAGPREVAVTREWLYVCWRDDSIARLPLSGLWRASRTDDEVTYHFGFRTTFTLPRNKACPVIALLGRFVVDHR